MIVNTSFEQLIDQVGEIIAQWSDSVTPDSVEPLPNNRYSPRYEWMYSFEKRLKYRIEDHIGRPIRSIEPLLFGGDGVLSEAMSNAFVHGNKRDSSLAIEVRTVVGSKGLCFTISDKGPGFAVDEIVDMASRGGQYFHFAGNGIRTLMQSEQVTAAFADRGRTLCLFLRY